MPGSVAVSTLQELCLNRFSLHLSEVSISDTFSSAELREMAPELRTFLQQNIPPCFYEELVHNTLELINKHFYNPKHKRCRQSMAEVAGGLLGERVRHLSLDRCRMLCDRVSVPVVFECLRHMPYLTQLAIGRLNFWKIPELATLADRLAGLPCLTVLRLEYICLPPMLTDLALKCPRLVELSLKDSERITNEEVPEIVRCSRLKSLNIAGTSVTGAGSWEILVALPQLTWFEHCPFNCNSGPFLFDSREEMLSYIWDFLSPEGRAYSAGLPSVTRHLASTAERQERHQQQETPAEPQQQEPPAEPQQPLAEPQQQQEPPAEPQQHLGEPQGQRQEPPVEPQQPPAEPQQQEPPAEPEDQRREHPAEPPQQQQEPRAEGAEGAAARRPSVVSDRSSASAGSRQMSPFPLSRSSSGVAPPRSFNIENFWLFNPKTEEVGLTRLCPALRHLRLDFVFQDLALSPDLSGLGQLRHIGRLELNSYDSPRFSVLCQILRQLGGGLSELALHVCDDYTATAEVENAVARFCPRLHRYSFTGDYSVRLPAERADDQLAFDQLRVRHPQLRHLRLGGFVSGRRLLFVAGQARQLVSLQLDGELRHLDDTGFLQLLAANPLQQLRELWVNVSSGLTPEAVSPLLFEPSCQLRRLGRLSSFQGIDRRHFLQLRDQVRSMNMDVDLVWVTPGV